MEKLWCVLVLSCLFINLVINLCDVRLEGIPGKALMAMCVNPKK